MKGDCKTISHCDTLIGGVVAPRFVLSVHPPLAESALLDARSERWEELSRRCDALGWLVVGSFAAALAAVLFIDLPCLTPQGASLATVLAFAPAYLAFSIRAGIVSREKRWVGRMRRLIEDSAALIDAGGAESSREISDPRLFGDPFFLMPGERRGSERRRAYKRYDLLFLFTIPALGVCLFFGSEAPYAMKYSFEWYCMKLVVPLACVLVYIVFSWINWQLREARNDRRLKKMLLESAAEIEETP